ncbi:methyltransferase family protein [Candidatus Uabimicrobium amorphum]|uniref:Steroid 5-alpha reductase C-terminal domain-containing protein n=1 Tax=Uabimicrobium amorphum TaxID=2596890 RepID=A0A5S9INM7_UABAM|nr:DUF1295 domain-containing protein [Candidatus Uabimicrobium amorphum]BBM84652.1 hypothetical protein UABAM_03013 [Candidatus Uabimicrobium amorphum]
MASLWWYAKVVLQLGMIAYVVCTQSFYHFSVYGQALVAFGASNNIYHNVIFKKSCPCLSEPKTLVTKGGLLPWIRHPMYLGDIIIGLGFLLIAMDIVCGILFLGLCVTAVMQSRWEEYKLRQLFPQEYPQWQKNSKTILPFIFLYLVVVFSGFMS